MAALDLGNGLSIRTVKPRIRKLAAGKIGEVGHLRYVYYERTATGGTRYLTVWTDDQFDLTKFLPSGAARTRPAATSTACRAIPGTRARARRRRARPRGADGGLQRRRARPRRRRCSTTRACARSAGRRTRASPRYARGQGLHSMRFVNAKGHEVVVDLTDDERHGQGLTVTAHPAALSRSLAALMLRAFDVIGAIVDGDGTRFRVWAPKPRSHRARARVAATPARAAARRRLTASSRPPSTASARARAIYYVARRRAAAARSGVARAARRRARPVGGGRRARLRLAARAAAAAHARPHHLRAAHRHLHARRNLRRRGGRARSARRPRRHRRRDPAGRQLLGRAQLGLRRRGLVRAAARRTVAPTGLRRLVDACHARGLSFILDVVYNHFGPEGNYVGEFAPYFTVAACTRRGATPSTTRASAPVRALRARQRAHVVRRVSRRRAAPRRRARHLRRLAAPHRRRGGRARARAGSLHHRRERPRRRQGDLVAAGGLGLRRAVVGRLPPRAARRRHRREERLLRRLRRASRSWRRRCARASSIRGSSRRIASGRSARRRARCRGDRFVVCAQNHDQIGNRAVGERLAHLRPGCEYAVAATVLLAPAVPMLFMGEEHADPAPFHYFTDHQDAGAGAGGARRASARVSRRGPRRRCPIRRRPRRTRARSSTSRSATTAAVTPRCAAGIARSSRLRREHPELIDKSRCATVVDEEAGGFAMIHDERIAVAVSLRGGADAAALPRRRVASRARRRRLRWSDRRRRRRSARSRCRRGAPSSCSLESSAGAGE